MALEWKLKAAGYDVDVDEQFDENTGAAVKMFELSNGLTGDGVVDAVLWGRLGLPGGAGGAPPVDVLREIPDVEDTVGRVQCAVGCRVLRQRGSGGPAEARFLRLHR